MRGTIEWVIKDGRIRNGESEVCWVVHMVDLIQNGEIEYVKRSIWYALTASDKNLQNDEIDAS